LSSHLQRVLSAATWVVLVASLVGASGPSASSPSASFTAAALADAEPPTDRAGMAGETLADTVSYAPQTTGPAAAESVEAAGTGDGGAASYGSMAGRALSAPMVAMAATPTSRGYWLLGADGGVFAFGDAPYLGSTGDLRLNAPVVGMAPTRRNGYWFVATDGGIFSYGDAPFHGSTGDLRLNRPIVGMAATPSGHGYWLVASDGGIFSFGDAGYHGSTGDLRLNSPIVGMSASPTGAGYWMVASDGGIFSFGDAGFHGSAADRQTRSSGMATSPGGMGYWIVAADGRAFAYGAAVQYPAAPASGVVGIAATGQGGYWVVTSSGDVFGTVGPSGSVGTAPSPAADQGAASYTFTRTNADGSPARWNPCAPIRWAMNPAGAPAGARADIDEALRRISLASGLTFAAQPDTTYTPYLPVDTAHPAGIDAVIAWSDEDTVPYLAGAPIGVGGAHYRFATDGRAQYVFGGVVVDRRDMADGLLGFTAGKSLGILLLHELSHMLGLGHVDDSRQVMYQALTGRQLDLGVGDRAGLARLGAGAGCLS